MNYYAEGLVQQAEAALNQGVLSGLAENRVAFVARSDVAAAGAGIQIGDGHAGAIYNATGPERLSGAERAPLIAEITGWPPKPRRDVLGEALKEKQAAGAGEDT